MKDVWIRARAYATGDTWLRWHDGDLSAESPAEAARQLVESLDVELPSIAVARTGDGTLLVGLTGYVTSQRRTNSPRTTASFLFRGDERESRRLAAALVAGMAEADSECLGAALTAQVIDGLDANSFRVGPELDTLLSRAEQSNLAAADPEAVLPSGSLRRDPESLRRIAAALANEAELPAVDLPLMISGRIEEGSWSGLEPWTLATPDEVSRSEPAPDPSPSSPIEPGGDEPWEDELATPPPTEADGSDRLIPARPGRIVSALVNVFALAGLAFTIIFFVIAARAAVDLADRIRAAFGFNPPAEGVDWFQLVVLALIFSLPVLAVVLLARVVRRRFARRLEERFGDPDQARPFSRRRGWDRRQWMAQLLRSDHWRPLAEGWQARGEFHPPAAEWSERDYRQAAALVRRELDERIGAVALATGIAVAVARQRITDAGVVVAGSAELQIETLATLGLRPRPSTWLYMARAAATGLLASTYIDVEERFEVQLAVRAAALGMDSTGALLEDTGDELDEALSEIAEGGGGLAGAFASIAGGAIGITGNVIRQVSNFVAEIGDEITEGVIVAAVLHYHGMSLVADALALDEDHRAELAPRLGKVPSSLRRGGMAVARRRTAKLRHVLRQRVVQATRRAPPEIGKQIRDLVTRPFRSRGSR